MSVQPPPLGNPPQNANDIFQEVCRGFRDSLSDDHRGLFVEYESSTAMLEAIHRHMPAHSNSNILWRCCRRIERLSERLNPFFKVVDIFVSSNPQYSAIAWGAIRLVFLVASNYAEFIEKISDMFERMGNRLPIYEQVIEELTRSPNELQMAAINTPRRLGEAACGRLRRALSYIYSDIIQFCCDICLLFSKTKAKFRFKFRNSFLSSSWKPFDTRFATLIKRWDEHRQIIELEMNSSATLHQLRNDAAVEKKLRSIEGYVETNDGRHKEDVTQELFRWIFPPPWLDAFEDVQDKLAENSAEWLANNAIVCGWVTERQLHSGYQFDVLHIVAKPGYGKTTLCTRLIETVQSGFGVRGHSSYKRFLGYFYFDTQRQDSIHSTSAWRAVLMQILRSFPNDVDILDRCLVLRNLRSGGQQVASKKEVISILKLVLEQLDYVYLIFDGIDECIDHSQFLETVTELYGKAKATSIALFSRPTLCVPPRLADNTVLLPLETGQNFEDIKRFIRPTIARFADESLLLSYPSVDDFVSNLASRANGMFLWAKLFLDYVQSPNLSARQKRNAIENISRLEGLDALFSAILRSLALNNTQDARMNATKALGITAYAHRPMHVDELMYAVAIPFDRKVELDDTIPNFAENIGRLSGALLELDSRRAVRFVHLSALEYMRESTGKSKGVSQAIEIEIDRASSYHCLASASLSYLFYTVQAGPLSGSRGVVPNAELQAKRLPFLDYATKSWSRHVLDYLDQAENFPSSRDDEILFQLASNFLSHKECIMTWIEASYLFKRSPQIRDGRFDQLLQRDIDTPFSTITHISVLDAAYGSLTELSRDLAKLNSSWSHILMNEPNEIWEPSISAFNPSAFWSRVPGSKKSPDGKYIATLTLYFDRDKPMDLSQAQIYFEHWVVNPRRKCFETSILISKSQLAPFIKSYVGQILAHKRSKRSEDHSFEFPVAISDDLMRVAIPGCVLRTDQANGDVDLQDIAFTDTAIERGPLRLDASEYLSTYDIQMSTTGRFLVTVHKSEGLVEVLDGTHCLVRLATVYEDTYEVLSRKWSYRYLCSLAFKPDVQDPEGSCVLLHPDLPILAVKYENYIVTKNYQETRVVRLPRSVENNAATWEFTGARVGIFKFTFVDSTAPLYFMNNATYFYDIRLPDRARSSMGHRNDLEHSKFRRPASSALAVRPRVGDPSNSMIGINGCPVVHQQGELLRYTDEQGVQYARQLDLDNMGNVVLGTLRGDGLGRAEMITRLPSWATRDRQASLLDAAHGDEGEERKIMIEPNKRPFKRHHVRISNESSEEPTNAPFLLTRQRDTIPAKTFHARLAPGETLDLVGQARKRICYPKYEGDDENADDHRLYFQ
ncbi:hypothetical protein F5Y10DRAFT_270507 [Nemania abortiva]|nr:hypothetical protein F5Y10DRAFT_270507 [Nemania abortiva]